MPRAVESKAVRKYLAVHAEPEAHSAELPQDTFDHVVVIPARGEGDLLFRAIGSVPTSPGGVLVIVVLNALETDAPERHAANARVLERLADRSGAPGGRALCLLDRARPGAFLPPKQGVGLARKIGCDLALALRAAGRIRSPYLHTTDADVVLPADYFERLRPFHARPPGRRPAAFTYPFVHEPAEDPDVARAITVYEMMLRYHRLGLAAAGSPYAFHTIGSTIAIDFETYAAVRGFPRKEAGEDFYLLDKAAKTGAIVPLGGEPIRIAARVSDRVPFGTGRALMDFRRGDRSADDDRWLDPRSFAALGGVIEWLMRPPKAGAHGAPGDLRREAEIFWAGTGLDAAPIADILEDMGAFAAVSRFLEPAYARVRLRALHTWFDAFRTLRFLHALRDRVYPKIPYREALRSAPFLDGMPQAAPDGAETAAALRDLDLARSAGQAFGPGASGEDPL